MDFVGLDKLSLNDFEDYCAAVVFAPACNFRCPFCHNGDSVLHSNTSIPFSEILNYLQSRKGILDAVVISGGEPTLMPDLEEKIIQIRQLGYKIKLDSNGTNPEIVEHLINKKLIDYVAMDIKNSEEKYSLTSGCQKVDIEKIKKTIDLLKISGICYEFRTTLVKEFHNLNDIEKLGQMIAGADKIYLQQFVDREGVIQKGLHPVSKEEALLMKDILSKYVKNVYLRGY